MPSVAVVVEWDNARLSEIDRAKSMLSQLQKQVVELSPSLPQSLQLIVVFDCREVDERIVRDAVKESIDMNSWNVDVRIISTENLDYYRQKNFGVKQASADIIIFLDSDVIPEPGWLQGIMDAFRDPGVQIVSGSAYLTTESFYERAFAAFWIFPTRKDVATLTRHNNFYANNVAFRKEVIEQHPFPESDTFRGQCTELAKQLKTNGYILYLQGSSQVSHPPPNGISHFIQRAIGNGHDLLLVKRRKQYGFLRANPAASFFRFVRLTLLALLKIMRRRTKVGLSVIEILPAFMIAVSYHFLQFIGEIITFFSPSLIRKFVSI